MNKETTAVSTLNNGQLLITGTTTAESPLSLKGPELNIEEIRFEAALKWAG